jgi:hypothetical protein
MYACHKSPGLFTGLICLLLYSITLWRLASVVESNNNTNKSTTFYYQHTQQPMDIERLKGQIWNASTRAQAFFDPQI